MISFAAKAQGGQSSFFLHVVNIPLITVELSPSIEIELPFNLGSLSSAKYSSLKSIEISFAINLLDLKFIYAFLVVNLFFSKSLNSTFLALTKPLSIE